MNLTVDPVMLVLQRQYLENGHIFMRHVNITAVTNYAFSVLTESVYWSVRLYDSSLILLLHSITTALARIKVIRFSC